MDKEPDKVAISKVNRKIWAVHLVIRGLGAESRRRRPVG